MISRRSRTLRSSRTLPGQLYSRSAAMAAGVDLLQAPAVLPRQLLQEVLGEPRDVVAALAQRPAR